MSDKNKNTRSKLQDFFRYFRNELTGKERNSFEKELQKDPFSEEALEGFALFSPEEELKDISDLQKRIKSRTARRQKFLLYRIAASVAVLMVISTIYIFIEKNKSGKHLAENSLQSNTLEITKSKPIAEPYSKNGTSEKQLNNMEGKADRSVTLKKAGETGKSVSNIEKLKIADTLPGDSVFEFKEEPNKTYLAEERIAAQANAMTKERSLMKSKEFDAKGDSQAHGRIDSSVSALNEVVVVAYGVNRKESENEEAISGHIPPQPIEGKSKFNKYLQNNLHRPDSLSSGQRVVVVVRFLVHTDGNIDSIRIVRSPGKAFSDEAMRVIRSGPSWKPAEDNGKPVEDEARLKIIFR